VSRLDGSVTVYVIYRETPQSRFDRSYYVTKHLPFVSSSWRRFGLEDVAVFFPAAERTGTIAICECRFRDEAAMAEAFGSAETQLVMADVPRFTDLAPERARATPL